jgi:hypothetical protein
MKRDEEKRRDRNNAKRRGRVLPNQDSQDEPEALDIITAALIARMEALGEPGEGQEVEWTRFGRKHKNWKDEQGREHLSKIQSYEFITDLPQTVRLQLYQTMIAMEPSFDINVYVNCERCDYEMRFPIHPQDPAFFYPSEI